MNSSLTQPDVSISFRESLKPYVELTKPRIVMLVVITTLLGYMIASGRQIDLVLLIHLLCWSGLSCAGVGILNQYLEVGPDGLMNRTKNRPLPARLVHRYEALILGICFVFWGAALLTIFVSPLSGMLAVITTVLYLLVYTPLKRVSWLNTVVGAIPGALPPVGGWVAATNSIDTGAMMLFLVMFLWQHPHFYSIAWLFKEDYEKGGFKMLTSDIGWARKTFFLQIFIFTLLLLPVTLYFCLQGKYSLCFSLPIFFIWLLFFLAAVRFYKQQDRVGAKNLLKSSVLYLPAALFIIVIQRLL